MCTWSCYLLISKVKKGFHTSSGQFGGFDFSMLDITQTASYEIILTCLFIHLPIRPSLNSLKIGSLVFSDIAHDDGWPWYLATDTGRLKKYGDPKLAAKWGFLPFWGF